MVSVTRAGSGRVTAAGCDKFISGIGVVSMACLFLGHSRLMYPLWSHLKQRGERPWTVTVAIMMAPFMVVMRKLSGRPTRGTSDATPY